MSIPSKSWLLSPNDKPYAEDLYNQVAKTSLTDNDGFPITDSAADNVQKKTLWSTVKNALKTYFDTLYAAVSHTHTKSQITDFPTNFGTGDMVQSTYDTNADGVVNDSDKLGGVAASGYAAASHTHTKSQITDFPEALGGDMAKSTYDTDNDGKVDCAEDSDKLGGVAASGYAKEFSGQGLLDYNNVDRSNDYYAIYDSSASVQCKLNTNYLGYLMRDYYCAERILNTSAYTDIDDADYVPMYDTSASTQKKSLWSNVKSVLKTYFDTLYAPKLASGSSTTNSTTGRSITHTFGSIAATAYRVIITPTLTAAPTTSTAGSLGEVYVVKNADGTFTVYNTGVTGVAFDWLAMKA